jgi:hypothetical protein
MLTSRQLTYQLLLCPLLPSALLHRHLLHPLHLLLLLGLQEYPRGLLVLA